MSIKLIYKMWLGNEGGRAFGEGPCRLLKGVELTGSLRGAASGIGMSYSKALRIIQACERSLGFTLITRKKGGVSGGGSEVTPRGVELMRTYEALRAETEEVIREAYRKHFGQSVQVQFHRVVTHRRLEEQGGGVKRD